LPADTTHYKQIGDVIPAPKSGGRGSRYNSPSFDVNIIKSSVSQNIPINQTLILNNGKKSKQMSRKFRKQNHLSKKKNLLNKKEHMKDNETNEISDSNDLKTDLHDNELVSRVS